MKNILFCDKHSGIGLFVSALGVSIILADMYFGSISINQYHNQHIRREKKRNKIGQNKRIASLTSCGCNFRKFLSYTAPVIGARENKKYEISA